MLEIDESVFEAIDNLRPALHKLQVRVGQTAHLALLIAWEYFTHEHSHSRADRWGEDGIAGISDNHQRICIAIALSTSKNQIFLTPEKMSEPSVLMEGDDRD